MSRVIVHRSLPPLKKVLANFSGFPANKSRQQVMIDVLRTAAKRLKSAGSQPFYSMRETAVFFRAPLGTISLVYKALEREGLLNRIRSSRTMLVGKKVLPREAVRGVVGIPIWLHSIVLMVYTRTLAMELEEHLRRSGYVADIIFHAAKEEEAEPEFATRLLRHRLDAVVLHTPVAGCRQNILSLRERGVRVLVIQRKEARLDLPAVIYLQDYQPAYQKMAEHWCRLGIRKVWLWSPLEHLHYKTEVDTFQSILNRRGLEIERVQDTPPQLLKRIRQGASKSPMAVAFLDSTHSEEICNCEPEIIEQISQNARLAFCVGSIRVPYLHFRKIRADVVDFSPKEIASRLADDVCRLPVLPDGLCHTFVAHYYEQMSL
jgi:hypothetical protein